MRWPITRTNDVTRAELPSQIQKKKGLLKIDQSVKMSWHRLHAPTDRLLPWLKDAEIVIVIHNFSIREAVLVPWAETWGWKVAFIQPGMTGSAYILKPWGFLKEFYREQNFPFPKIRFPGDAGNSLFDAPPLPSPKKRKCCLEVRQYKYASAIF